jgi:curved DNA-binding protein CbpA
MSTPQAPKNHYKTLGLDREATRADVKHAYRELAREWHPDVNSSDAAEARFKGLTEAYEVLSDAQKRREYDQQTATANPETSISTAGRMKKFIREGGTPTNEMLLDALRDNGDAETVNVLLAAGVVPDKAALAYAVQNLSSYMVAKLIKWGGAPTAAMLQDTVTHRNAAKAKVLLDSGVPPTAEAARLVKEDLQPRGWSGQKSLWEDTLSSTFGKSVKAAGVSVLRSLFSNPKPPQP